MNDEQFCAAWNYIKNGAHIGIRETGDTFISFNYIVIGQGNLRPPISSSFYIDNAFDGYLDATRILRGNHVRA
jgi:hypothetical protein